jgi:hypothetical protein
VATISCCVCGQPVSFSAITCPNCGEPASDENSMWNERNPDEVVTSKANNPAASESSSPARRGCGNPLRRRDRARRVRVSPGRPLRTQTDTS